MVAERLTETKGSERLRGQETFRHSFDKPVGAAKEFLSDAGHDRFYTSYEDRLFQTPALTSTRGEWEGGRGESKFIPSESSVKEALAKYGQDGIRYKNAEADFSPVSVGCVIIDGMTASRAKNFRQADEACAKQWNESARDGRTDWTPRDVKAWRKTNGFSWHECCDCKTCLLVDKTIHGFFSHSGGVCECAKRDGVQGGGYDD